jgi:hypothetical protein
MFIRRAMQGPQRHDGSERSDHTQNVVGHHIERLLLLALHVDRATAVRIADQPGDMRALHERVDRLARRLNR